MKINLEQLLILVQKKTQGMKITFLQQKNLATEMLKYYRRELQVIEDEAEAKSMTVRILEDKIVELKAKI